MIRTTATRGYSPLLIPEGCRPAIAEAVARANYGLRVGKFEFDFNDGELRFQAAQIRTDGEVGDRLIITTINMLDTYLPAFLSVVYGNELPKDAIEFVEVGRGRSADDGDRGFGERDQGVVVATS